MTFNPVGLMENGPVTLVEYTFLALSSLFVIVNPIAVVPAFVAMTPHDSVEARLKMARLASLVGGGVLVFFVVTGPLIFRLLGITLPAFQIAGSIILLLMAIDMVQARRSKVQETQAETDAGMQKDDIAVTPLAVPMLSGPGAISTTLILLNQAVGWFQISILVLCIAAVFTMTYYVLRLAVGGTAFINPLAIKIMSRLMGLLLAAIAVQFVINALRELGVMP